MSKMVIFNLVMLVANIACYVIFGYWWNLVTAALIFVALAVIGLFEMADQP